MVYRLGYIFGTCFLLRTIEPERIDILHVVAKIKF